MIDRSIGPLSPPSVCQVSNCAFLVHRRAFLSGMEMSMAGRAPSASDRRHLYRKKKHRPGAACYCYSTPFLRAARDPRPSLNLTSKTYEQKKMMKEVGVARNFPKTSARTTGASFPTRWAEEEQERAARAREFGLPNSQRKAQTVNT